MKDVSIDEQWNALTDEQRIKHLWMLVNQNQGFNQGLSSRVTGLSDWSEARHNKQRIFNAFVIGALVGTLFTVCRHEVDLVKVNKKVKKVSRGLAPRVVE
jgi:hypothetical protein